VCSDFVHSFIPHSFPKRDLHRQRTWATSFSFQYPFVFKRPFSSYLRVHFLLPVGSIVPYIFPLIMCFRRQFLRRCDQSGDNEPLWLNVTFVLEITWSLLIASTTKCVTILSDMYMNFAFMLQITKFGKMEILEFIYNNWQFIKIYVSINVISLQHKCYKPTHKCHKPTA